MWVPRGEVTKLGKEMEALRKKIQSLENTRLALDKDKVRHLLKEQSNEIFYLPFFSSFEPV